MNGGGEGDLGLLLINKTLFYTQTIKIIISLTVCQSKNAKVVLNSHKGSIPAVSYVLNTLALNNSS